ERAVYGAIHRRLIVTASGDQHHRGFGISWPRPRYPPCALRFVCRAVGFELGLGDLERRLFGVRPRRSEHLRAPDVALPDDLSRDGFAVTAVRHDEDAYAWCE